MPALDPEQPGEQPLPEWQTSPGWWFKRIGIPVLVLLAIVGTIVWLEGPSDDVTRRIASSDEPLEADSTAPQEGAPAPNFVMATLDGQQVSLSDLKGKVVVLNFWATWCGPCRDEMPLFQEAANQHAEDGLVVIAVNVREGASTVRLFVEKLKLRYTIGMDEKGAVAGRYRVRSFPTTYFVGRDGAIEGRRVGSYTRQILFGRLEQLLDVP